MTIQQQFHGFLNTPNLWKEKAVFGMEQLELTGMKGDIPSKEFNPKLRLGKLVEEFVFEVLNQSASTEIIAENIQIRKEKISIGEIDCILKHFNELIHLEIVYKFYLYDERIEGSNLHKWIGPNRKDNLIHKLTKLKEKQLPMLFREEAQKSIDALNIDLKINDENILQKVLFKAQLFVPKSQLLDTFPSINNDCIKGFYIPYIELKDLRQNEFYIPNKRAWLTEPHLDVEWLNYNQFDNEINVYYHEQRSPLCWIKTTDGTTQKFFVVSWD
tara:strand:+ start:2189 stop:3004 length:816 start_codon:yes stop_codon:yes gene_type:complete